ncbi:PEBP-like protein, partial [Tricholoma matsutake]
SPLTNVTQAFSQAKIVPDVLKSFNPTALVNMNFAGSTNLSVTTGSLLTEPQTAAEPTFFLVTNSTNTVNQTFVLVLVDPDAPTPQNPNISQYLHFLAGNFHTNTAASNPTLLTNQSAALMDYFPPTPPAGSDPHRYVLVVYDQPATFNAQASSFVNATTSRQHFNLTTFASVVNLGTPIAGNFFLVGPGNSTTTSSPTSTAPKSTKTSG